MPRHLYPLFKSGAQTARQLQKHATMHTGSPRQSSTFCKISPLYPLPIQSYSDSCEFHWLPLAGLKCTPKSSCIGYHKYTPYLHAHKTLLKNNEYLWRNRVLNIYLYKLNWHWPSHCPLCTCSQCLYGVNSHSLDK